MRWLIFLIFATANARASEPVYLEKGEPAPFSGELIESRLGHRLLYGLAQAREAKANAVRSLGLLSADLNAERALRKAEVEAWGQKESAYKNSIASLEQAVRDATRPEPFFLSPEFLIPTTAAVTVVVTLLVVNAVR